MSGAFPERFTPWSEVLGDCAPCKKGIPIDLIKKVR